MTWRPRVLRSPVAASVGSEGGSWYCAAADVGVEAPAHTVVISAVSDEDVLLRLDAFSSEGEVGTTAVEVEAGSTAEVDAAEEFGTPNVSVMVEADAPVAVEHRYVFDAGADQAPCTTFSSDTWYFPTLDDDSDAPLDCRCSTRSRVMRRSTSPSHSIRVCVSPPRFPESSFLRGRPGWWNSARTCSAGRSSRPRSPAARAVLSQRWRSDSTAPATFR